MFQPLARILTCDRGVEGFATMMPALDWLQLNAGKFGSPSPALFYWGSGILSSVLDNAPTYLSFLKAIFGAFVNEEIVKEVRHLVENGGTDLAAASGPAQAAFAALRKYYGTALAGQSVTLDEIELAFVLGNLGLNQYLVAISVGAVFFGANTYIGNGPNFMVKSIADQHKVNCPSFLGYVFKFSLPYMLPMLLVIWLLFFR